MKRYIRANDEVVAGVWLCKYKEPGDKVDFVIVKAPDEETATEAFYSKHSDLITIEPATKFDLALMKWLNNPVIDGYWRD